jgi:hypothetical protein
MTRETPPLSSILDRVVIYCAHAQTHPACPLCMRAMSPAVCSGCTMRSEECCCCKTPFRPLQRWAGCIAYLARAYPLDLPLSHLAWRADRRVRQCQWTGHAAPPFVGCDGIQGQRKARHPQGGRCIME